MARSEKQELIAQLTLQDQLSGPLAAAKQNLIQTDNALGRVGTTAKASGASLGGLSGSLTSIAKVGAGAFLGFQALNIAAGFLSDSADAARADEESISKLTATIKANTPAWQENQASIEQHIQANTAAAFSDDELRQSLAALVTGTHDVAKAFEDQSLAIDLARFSNSSLQDASQALVNVEAGRFRGLAQLGINIKGITTSEEALARIRDTVAGQSQAFLETDAGRAAKSKVSIDELQESFGRLGANIGAEVAGPLANFFDFLSGVKGEQVAATGDAFVTAIKDHFTHATTQELENLRASIQSELDKSRNQLKLFGIDLPVGNFIGESDAIKRALDEVNLEIQVQEGMWGSDAESMRGAANDAGKLGDAMSGAGRQVDDATQKLIDNALAAGEVADAHARATDPIGLVADHFGKLSDQSLLAGNSLDAAAVAAQSTNAELFNLGNSADVAATKAQAVADALSNIPTTTDAFVNVILTGAAAGAGVGTFQPLTAGGGANPNIVVGPNGQLIDTSQGTGAHGDTGPAQRAAAEAARKAQQAADEAARKAAAAAKKAAEELARAYKEKVTTEFERAKKTVETLFDAYDKRVNKAIDEAEKLAQKNHDAAVQAIADNLKAEEAKHAAPVNAAESALAATQAEEQRRNLVEAQQAAAAAQQANRDPAQAADLARSLRDATEALANFDAQAAIDRLKAVQAGLDAASEASAKTQTAAADAKLQAAKDEAQKERDAETLAAKKRKDDFETQLAALEKRDLAANKTPKQIQADIDALEKRFGITTDTLGFHHIDDPLVTAIKNVKIDPPQVTVINNQKFLLQVGPNELRLIASAISSGNQPAATSSVRTGANGRG